MSCGKVRANVQSVTVMEMFEVISNREVVNVKAAGKGTFRLLELKHTLEELDISVAVTETVLCQLSLLTVTLSP